MRSPFFVAAALAARAIAQVPLQINTPGGANTANECQPCLITWSGGTPPYFINVQDSVGNDIVNSFNSVSGTSVTWTVDASAGTSLMFTIRDNNGDTTSSAPFTVGPGSGDSCLPSNPPPSGTGGSSVTSVAPATSPSNSPPATSPSQTSGPPPTGTSTPGSGSAPNSQTGTNQEQTAAATHHSKAGAIAGGVVGGTLAIMLALLGWWYVRRRQSAEEGSRFDVVEKPQFLASPIGTALAGTPALHTSDPHEFRPWDHSEARASVAPLAVAPGDPKEPVILRWDPPASRLQPEAGQPRERALEEEVRRLREHITNTSSPSAASPLPRPELVQSRERELEEEVRRLRDHISAISPPSYAGYDDIR